MLHEERVGWDTQMDDWSDPWPLEELERRRRNEGAIRNRDHPFPRVSEPRRKKQASQANRMDEIAKAVARVQAKPKCACGRRADKLIAGKCPSCYEKARNRKFFKFDVSGREKVLQAVEAMAAQERKSVSEMFMVLVNAELVRREKA